MAVQVVRGEEEWRQGPKTDQLESAVPSGGMTAAQGTDTTGQGAREEPAGARRGGQGDLTNARQHRRVNALISQPRGELLDHLVDDQFVELRHMRAGATMRHHKPLKNP